MSVDTLGISSLREERQMHDAMLAAIVKAVHEDTVPESSAGIFSTGTKDKMGCKIPRLTTGSFGV